MSNFCTECGAPKAAADERFCGACGSPFAAVAQSTAPAPAPPMSGPSDPEVTAVRPVWRPPAGPPQTPTMPTPQPWPASAAPQGQPARRRRFVVPAVATTVVLALAGAGLVAWQVLGPRGGASDPAAATTGFVEALAAQDPIAALDMVVPGEVAGLDDLYGVAAERLDSLGITSGDGVTAAVALELSGLELDVTQVGEDVAVVRLAGGRYELEVDPAALPGEMDDARQGDPESWSGDLLADLDVEDPDDAPWLVTVQVDGRWYVSILGSLADYAFGGLLDADAELLEELAFEGIRGADPYAVSEGVEAIVGADLDEVLENLASAVRSGSMERLLANLPADQVVGLLPFMGAIQDLVAQELTAVDLQVTDLAVGDTTEDGDLLTVTIDRAVAQAAVTDFDGTDVAALELEGTCGFVTEESDTDGGCLPGAFVDTFGVTEPFVVLRKVDGGFQLDPIATAAAVGQIALTSIPDRVISDLLRAVDDEDDSAACFALGLGEYC